jgi:hypothetical protein
MTYVLVLWLGLAGLGGFANTGSAPQTVAQGSTAVSTPAAPTPVDPNKAPSEFNHHVAGWVLIAVGILVLTDRRTLRNFWPALFLIVGLFLAVWSDAEIWPRGNLSWIWLLHHDQEAGQHKIYALLLIAMSVVEYLRAWGFLNRFWRAWAFPILALMGAALLLVHDHTAGAGATLSEARAYLVNPALDVDGKPPREHAASLMAGMDDSMMDMDHSGSSPSPIPTNRDYPAATTNTSAPDHHHQMTSSMLMVKREHFWFMIVGVSLALFKLISDRGLWRRYFFSQAWPSSMVLLGVLLVLYRE